MHSINAQHSPEPGEGFNQRKAGISMVEVLMATVILMFISMGIWANVFLQNRSFQYNRISNRTVNQASLGMMRMIKGSGTYWGLRACSRADTSVVPTGVVGSEGQTGWAATCNHGIDDVSGLPSVLAAGEMVWTYDPVDREIDVNGTVVIEDVEESYFTIQNGYILLGIRTLPEEGGSEAMMESRIRMRNP